MLKFLKSPMGVYSVAHRLHRWGVPVMPQLLTYLIRLVWAAYIPHTARLGEGLVLGYGGLGVVIHGRAVVGRGCHIDQGVTIGGTSRKPEVPVLGDDVYVGAGAKILGAVRVGSNVVIGANAVVIRDVPDNSLVVGVPGRVVKTGIKKADYV